MPHTPGTDWDVFHGYPCDDDGAAVAAVLTGVKSFAAARISQRYGFRCSFAGAIRSDHRPVSSRLRHGSILMRSSSWGSIRTSIKIARLQIFRLQQLLCDGFDELASRHGAVKMGHQETEGFGSHVVFLGFERLLPLVMIRWLMRRWRFFATASAGLPRRCLKCEAGRRRIFDW